MGPSVEQREATIAKVHSLEHGALPIWLACLIDRCDGAASAPGLDFRSSAVWTECKMQEVRLATSELEQPNLFGTVASMYLYQVLAAGFSLRPFAHVVDGWPTLSRRAPSARTESTSNSLARTRR